MKHIFTDRIIEILSESFPKDYEEIFEQSNLIRYINIKTQSASKGSKSRGSFASLYAIYVLVEDYFKQDFHITNLYADYPGARFVDLFKRQKELPFGSKLQNHALNSRMNEEFKKYFPTCDYTPILRDSSSNRYWINQNLLQLHVNKQPFNISEVLIKIIDAYIQAKRGAFETFIEACESLKHIQDEKPEVVEKFIEDLLAPNVDARLFEIVSYAILKYYYHDQKVYFGFNLDELTVENLKLYKTGRTNANDGGIDYVMKPLGKFFQVTETIDVKKYFLDIDKLEKFPVTFVIKSTLGIDVIRETLEANANRQYSVKAVVKKYMDCIEELINIPLLLERFKQTVNLGYLSLILTEIVTQSKIEFNYEEEE